MKISLIIKLKYSKVIPFFIYAIHKAQRSLSVHIEASLRDLEALYMRPDMKLMPAPVFISGAGLSYCCVYMMSGRYELSFGGDMKFHVAFSCRHENGMKISCKQNFLMSGRYENQIAFVDCCLFFVFSMTYLKVSYQVTW